MRSALGRLAEDLSDDLQPKRSDARYQGELCHRGGRILRGWRDAVPQRHRGGGRIGYRIDIDNNCCARLVHSMARRRDWRRGRRRRFGRRRLGGQPDSPACLETRPKSGCLAQACMPLPPVRWPTGRPSGEAWGFGWRTRSLRFVCARRLATPATVSGHPRRRVE
jgi:hypothetical protein